MENILKLIFIVSKIYFKFKIETYFISTQKTVQSIKGLHSNLWRLFYMHKKSSNITQNQLPEDTAWLFPEYDFEKMGVESHRGVIIERILEKGTWDQLRWLFSTYGEKNVAEWVRKHGFRLLSKRSFALWRLALGIKKYQAPDWAIEMKKMDIW